MCFKIFSLFCFGLGGSFFDTSGYHFQMLLLAVASFLLSSPLPFLVHAHACLYMHVHACLYMHVHV